MRESKNQVSLALLMNSYLLRGIGLTAFATGIYSVSRDGWEAMVSLRYSIHSVGSGVDLVALAVTMLVLFLMFGKTICGLGVFFQKSRLIAPLGVVLSVDCLYRFGGFVRWFSIVVSQSPEDTVGEYFAHTVVVAQYSIIPSLVIMAISFLSLVILLRNRKLILPSGKVPLRA